MKTKYLLFVITLLILISAQRGGVGARRGALYGQTMVPKVKLGVAVIVLRPYGLEPEQIQIRPGPTLIAVYNRTGADRVILRIEREAVAPPTVNELLSQDTIPVQKRAIRGILILTPGQYIVSAATARFTWQCRIVVKPA